MGLINKLLYNEDFQRVENDQRFNFMLQTMQSNRWKITLLILFTFFFIVFGIVLAVMFKASIEEAWKELLLILLGAFVGNLNKVVDFWFSTFLIECIVYLDPSTSTSYESFILTPKRI